MASIIDGIIPAQQYETIRDKIGLILYEELVNQFTLTTDEDLNVKVFVERFVAFDKTDFPCLNVVFSGGNYDNKNKQDATSTIMGRLTFNVRALEDTQLLDALPIDNWKTQVKLNLTEKGYLYEKI